MFNNIYEFIKKILKYNYKEIIFVICFILIANYPVPYYIFTSGGITDLSERFEVENGFTQKGSYNLSYVTEVNGTIFTYFMSFIVPNWDLVKISDYQINTTESLEDLAIRDKLSLEIANQSAVKVAYERAGKEFKINKEKLYIVYISEYLKSTDNLKVGDEILYIDDIEVSKFEDLSNCIEKKEVGDKVTLTLKRKDKIITTDVLVQNIDGSKSTGIGMYIIYDYEVNPEIKFNFSGNESGSSAGFMTSLAIYDTLIEQDLTSGLKIAGTGTIDSYGNVGEIGGVEYKLKGAVNESSDIFFVPIGNNYDECINLKKEKNYNINIVGISTIDDAIEYLKELKS